MEKKWSIGLLALVSLACVLLPAVLAQEEASSGLLSGVWWKMMSLGNLSFLGIPDASLVVGFCRILLGIFIFTAFFAVMTGFGKTDLGKGTILGFLSKPQAIVISLVIAIITAVFLPAQVILAAGAGWATLVALILIGGPVAGIAYLLWNLDGWLGQDKPTRGTIFLKIILCVLLVFILMSMAYHVYRMSGSLNPVFISVQKFISLGLLIAEILLVCYVIRFFTVEGPTKEEKAAALEETRKAISDKWKERKEKLLKKKELGEREKLLGASKGFVIRAEEKADDLFGVLGKKSDSALREAKGLIGEIKENLRLAKRVLRTARRKTKAEKSEFLLKLSHYLEAMEQMAERQMYDALPGSEKDPQWARKVSLIRNNIKNFRAGCGYLMKSIDRFIEEEHLEEPAALAVGRPTPSPGVPPPYHP